MINLLWSCNHASLLYQSDLTSKSDSRLQTIIERGKLIAVTDPGATSYFVYRSQPMGYQFELLQQFAKQIGVRLEIHVERDPKTALEKLNEGYFDIVAKTIVITRERSETVDFMAPMITSRQVLVQRKPKGWRQMATMEEVNKRMVRQITDLAGKTIHVPKNSAFYYRLVHVQQEIKADIDIAEVSGKDPEDFLRMLANGEINYTVCDENVARVAQKVFPELDAETVISLPAKSSWAVGKGNESLLNALNLWWAEFSQTEQAALLYDKYFSNPMGLLAGQRDYHLSRSGQISGYDETIRKYSSFLNWDWRLLASLIYQESKFMPDVTSHKGAYGIMQMMPNTAMAYGVDSSSTPQEHIEAGVKHLRWLDNQLKKEIENSAERQKFVLAAYNAGLEHVNDARRLAVKHKKDPNVWDNNVDYFMLNKSNPKYYRDDVVQYGYCRGEEPYKFVREIIERYDHYRWAVTN